MSFEFIPQQFAPEKLSKPKRKGLSSNRRFSGVNLLFNFGGVFFASPNCRIQGFNPQRCWFQTTLPSHPAKPSVIGVKKIKRRKLWLQPNHPTKTAVKSSVFLFLVYHIWGISPKLDFGNGKFKTYLYITRVAIYVPFFGGYKHHLEEYCTWRYIILLILWCSRRTFMANPMFIALIFRFFSCGGLT